MKIDWFDSIQTRLIILLIGATSVFFAGFMWIQYSTAEKSMGEELGRLADFIADNLSGSLAVPLWDFDAVSTNAILEAVYAEKQLLAIFIHTKEATIYGKIRNRKWRMVDTDMPPTGNNIHRRKEILRKGVVIGFVDIYMTQRFMKDKLYRTIGSLLVSLIILNIILFAIVMIYLRKTVIEPIRGTTSYLRRLSSGLIPPKITTSFKGEFNEIRDCLNHLIDTTNATILLAENIADGNLDSSFRQRSREDRMVRAMNRMLRKLGEIMNETEKMVGSVGEGRLDIRGDIERFEGGWRDMVSSVNNLIDTLAAAVAQSAAVEMEMALTRKIQTTLLPESPGIPGYDIAAGIESAQDVGGDYYDILFAGDRHWIVMGDVSGHGVSAGLVMMMVQTAIHTVVTENPPSDPARLLEIVNRVIHENLRKMGERKYMTIVVMTGGKDGIFTFAGLHEDILIRDGKTGEVREIETTGMWIGLEPDIAGMLKTGSLTLAPGDTLLLFTDGITEARRSTGEMFGNAELVNILSASGDKSAKMIHDEIFSAILSCSRADDMTLFVMRRL